MRIQMRKRSYQLHDDSEDESDLEEDDNCDGKIPCATNTASTLPSLNQTLILL